MGLAILGVDDFQQSGPEEWNMSLWDLDTLTIPWRGGIEKLETFLSSNNRGDVSPIDGNMFLVNMIPDQHKQFPTVRMVYQGRREGILPAYKHDFDDQVMSASSRKTSSGFVLAAPATVQFYAPTNLLTYYTRAARSPSNLADNPANDPTLINYTINDTSFNISGPIMESIALLFSVSTTATEKATEVVPGQYFKNEDRKTKIWVPYTFTLTAGAYMELSIPGENYQVGGTVSVSAGGQSAVARITATGISGSILAWTQLSNSFTTPQSQLPAQGAGNGAAFNIIIIT